MIGARDLDQGASREGDAHSLALAAVDSVVPKPATGGAIRRPSRATVRARAIAVRERGDDEVAHTDAAYLCPDLLYDPDELVADWAQRVGGLTAVVPEVGATDATQHDPNDGVGRLDDRRVGSVRHLDTAGSEKDSSTHRYASSTFSAATYSSSLTWAPQLALLPLSSTSTIERWVMKRSGAAPCQ